MPTLDWIGKDAVVKHHGGRVTGVTGVTGSDLRNLLNNSYIPEESNGCLNVAFFGANGGAKEGTTPKANRYFLWGSFGYRKGTFKGLECGVA